jgi:hypothetical protein
VGRVGHVSLLTLSDVMGTGHHAALRANVRPGNVAHADRSALTLDPY